MKSFYVPPIRTAGLNNLKMVLVGVKEIARINGGDYGLPKKVFDFTPTVDSIGDGYLPIEEVFDRSSIASRFSDGEGSECERIGLSNQECLEAAGVRISLRRNAPKNATDEVALDYSSFKPCAELAEQARDIVRQLPGDGQVCALQLRIERDWQEYAARKGWVDGQEIGGVEVVLNHRRIFDKIMVTPDLPRTIYICSDEDDLPISHREIEKDARDRGLELVFKSFFRVDTESRLKKSVIDFAVCEQISFYVGTARSTFSNILCMVKAAEIGCDPFHYVFDACSNEVLRRTDFGSAVNASAATKTVVV